MAMSKMEEIGRILIHSGADKVIRDVVSLFVSDQGISKIYIFVSFQRMRTPAYYFVYKQEIRDIKREEQNLTI